MKMTASNGLIFTTINEDGAKGTLDGKEFEVIAERDDGHGNTEYGVVEGDFTEDDLAIIFTAWLIEQELE
jgi:hypothetical protein